MFNDERPSRPANPYKGDKICVILSDINVTNEHECYLLDVTLL